MSEKHLLKRPESDANEISLERIQELIRFSEFKRIVDNTNRLRLQKSYRSFAIISNSIAEGKTLITAALALAFSQIFKLKVLALDSQSKLNPGSLSLSGILESSDADSTIGSSSGPRATMHLNLDCMSLDNLRRLLGNNAEYKLAGFVEEQSLKYDMILIDTTALAAKNQQNFDPIITAKIADASILVVKQNSVLNRDNLIVSDPDAAALLKIKGLVFNGGQIYE